MNKEKSEIVIIIDECIKLSNEIEEKLGAAALQPIGKLYDGILQNGVSNRYLGPGENDTVENWQKIKALCESILQYGREQERQK